MGPFSNGAEIKDQEKEETSSENEKGYGKRLSDSFMVKEVYK